MKFNRSNYVRRITGFALIVMAGTQLAFAAGTVNVTVPSTFAAGTTISSAAVNGNFTSLASQMPAVKETGISNSGLALASGAFTNVGSLTITAPANGTVVVRFDGNAYVPSAGAQLIVAASDLSGSLGSVGTGDIAVYLYPTSNTNLTLPFSQTRVYPVTAGQTHTYYAVVDGAPTGTYKVFGTLTVEFFANSL